MLSSEKENSMNNTSNTMPPAAAMLNMISGYWVSQMVFVAARLNIADLLSNGAMSVKELAAKTKVDEAGLFRLLRALACVGVFAETKPRHFELTDLGATLSASNPRSLKAFALMMIDDYNWKAWSELGFGIESGELPFEKVFGEKVFEYLEHHPDKARTFGESMSSLSNSQNPSIAKAYDYTAFEKLVDVGGGHGSLLATILSTTPKLQGVLFDSPSVVALAPDAEHMKVGGVAKRIKIVGGDFFEEVPQGDSYIMKYIMHDWSDDLAVKILKNVRRQIPKNGKLLIVDTVIPTGNDFNWGKLLDINMLVLTGGKERSEAEFTDLLKDAGFALNRVIPTECPLSIVEGVPV